jgi:nucleoside 2-deoxyribosyltransferase
MPSSDLRAYFAAPLFNERERTFNKWVVEQLERHVSVFLPHRDGSLLVNMLAAGVPRLVAERRVFQQDCGAMQSADVLIAVLDGAHIDEGVAFEIGFMHALGKLCIGLQTDVRRALPSGNNPMITQGLDEILGDVETLVARIEALARDNASSRPVRA